MSAGTVNYKANFEPSGSTEEEETEKSTTESTTSKDNVIAERWQQLAGLLKG